MNLDRLHLALYGESIRLELRASRCRDIANRYAAMRDRIYAAELQWRILKARRERNSDEFKWMHLTDPGT